MPNLQPVFENQEQKEKKTTRLNRYSAYLYLAMALTIVGVAVASIISLNRSVDELPSYSTPSFSITPDASEDSTVEIIIPIPPETDKDTPVFDEESDVVDNTPSLPPVAEQKPLYALPIQDGEIVKECALDTLVFSATMNDYRVHTGIDIAAPLGEEVYCYSAGTVESVKADDFYGTVISVRHEHGLVTVYANLSPTLAEGIAVGTELKTGDVLGYVGKTALSESADDPHLHFEMILDGKHIDPEQELYN